jgi:hypothetical protein
MDALKAEHFHLAYVPLQRQLNHLSGLSLDRREV